MLAMMISISRSFHLNRQVLLILKKFSQFICKKTSSVKASLSSLQPLVFIHMLKYNVAAKVNLRLQQSKM